MLRRALMDATCAASVTATKPCGRIPKLQGTPRETVPPQGSRGRTNEPPCLQMSYRGKREQS